MSPEQISIVLLQRKKTVHGCSKLAAQVPVIQRRCQYDHIALPHRRIDLIHVVSLDTGTFFCTVSTEAALTAVDIHIAQKEFPDDMPGLFRTLCKGAYQG